MKTPPDPSNLTNGNGISPQFLEDVTKDIMSKAKSKTDEDILIEKANHILIEVRNNFLLRHKIRITPMKFKDAADEIRKMYREHYRTWTHEELIEFCSLKDGILAAESLRHELI